MLARPFARRKGAQPSGPYLRSKRSGRRTASHSHERRSSAPSTQSSSVGERDKRKRYLTPAKPPPAILTRNKARSRRAGGANSSLGQPTDHLPAQSLRGGVLSKFCGHFLRRMNAKDRNSELQTDAQHTFRTHIPGGLAGFLPVHFGMTRGQSGHIGNPDEPLPEMLCAMNAVQQQFIFEAQRRHIAAVQRHAPLAGIEILDAHGPRIVAKGALGVEFDEALRAGALEEIFAGYFSGLDGAFWNVRIETQGDHVLRCRQNIAVANDQVEIDVAPHRRVTVSQK